MSENEREHDDELEPYPMEGVDPLPVIDTTDHPGTARITCERCPVGGSEVLKKVRRATSLREGERGVGVGGPIDEVHLCPMYKFDPNGFCVYENAKLELPKLTSRRAWFDTLGIVAHDVIRTYDVMGRMFEAVGNGKAMMQVAGLKAKFINQLFLGYRAGFMDQIQEREDLVVLNNQQILQQLMHMISSLVSGGVEIPIEMVTRALQGTEANATPATDSTAGPHLAPLDDDPPGDEGDDSPKPTDSPAA